MRSAAGGRSGRSIFSRTFLLLAAALVLAQCIGLAVLFLRTPVYNPPVQLPELVALLSTRMPASSPNVSVTDEREAPAPSAGMNREDPFMRRVLAGWLRQDLGQIRVYRPHHDVARGEQERLNDGMVPLSMGQEPAWMRRRGVATIPGMTAGPFVASLPPEAVSQDDIAPASGQPTQSTGLTREREGPLVLRFGAGLENGFIAAAQQDDGHWRVVRYAGRTLSTAFKLQLLALFSLGLLLMLPLAWWFSRALSKPIRDFAAAADRLGRDPDAPPLERRGPAEILQATDSFNAMQARLNRMVAERTHMVGAIAHDLRTPLARLAFRLDDIDSPLRERAAADIDEMKHMITVALEFLRDQSFRGPRERLDFRDLVESVVDDAADIGQDVSLTPDSQSVMIDADPLALRRVVGNLIGNAVKYGTRARVKVRAIDGHALLEIEDDGPGIDMELGDKLFMPFFRGENSRNKETGGIGLGLAAARAIVLRHGGEIGLANLDQGGLQAWVTLPRARDDA
ncbi:ATP-binding protein [Pseudoxanthomonas sp. X-1]|uniref:ATP-binding protein n=1 Tax=Pseudoxanthomonas sp. X-1 TaxID=2571115 RepID=UPI00110AD9E7|nr:ATP-binding protein [Pseudoxanthomonas sp. X-1]TMN20161.1 HAMP domain-containing protein [Pseudoxanthomonas sp. X-1]UAY75020.1 HAMP domain-containing protein [Pseudoxanthomonas sp. X-1]